MSKDSKTDKSGRDSHYAALRRTVRDAKRERGEIPTPAQSRRDRAPGWKPPALAPDQVYLYGLHTVRAALDNPERKIIKLSVSQNAAQRLELPDFSTLPYPVETVLPSDLDKVLGADAIHQGVMLETRP